MVFSAAALTRSTASAPRTGSSSLISCLSALNAAAPGATAALTALYSEPSWCTGSIYIVLRVSLDNHTIAGRGRASSPAPEGPQLDIFEKLLLGSLLGSIAVLRFQFRQQTSEDPYGPRLSLVEGRIHGIEAVSIVRYHGGRQCRGDLGENFAAQLHLSAPLRVLPELHTIAGRGRASSPAPKSGARPTNFFLPRFADAQRNPLRGVRARSAQRSAPPPSRSALLTTSSPSMPKTSTTRRAGRATPARRETFHRFGCSQSSRSPRRALFPFRPVRVARLPSGCIAKGVVGCLLRSAAPFAAHCSAVRAS